MYIIIEKIDKSSLCKWTGSHLGHTEINLAVLNLDTKIKTLETVAQFNLIGTYCGLSLDHTNIIANLTHFNSNILCT